MFDYSWLLDKSINVFFSFSQLSLKPLRKSKNNNYCHQLGSKLNLKYKKKDLLLFMIEARFLTENINNKNIK